MIDNSTRALKTHKLIKKLLKKLDELGYEFMFFNNISSIRQKRNLTQEEAEYEGQREKNLDHANDSMTNNLEYDEHNERWVNRETEAL
tara:strand:+ start:1724 stop:1987 length:264 start_codon:yes stop_codon:yes gene_type:complete